MNPRESESTAHPAPALHGNPAYPSLEERRKIVEKNKKRPEPVKKIPADFVKKSPGSAESKSRPR